MIGLFEPTRIVKRQETWRWRRILCAHSLQLGAEETRPFDGWKRQSRAPNRWSLMTDDLLQTGISAVIAAVRMVQGVADTGSWRGDDMGAVVKQSPPCCPLAPFSASSVVYRKASEDAGRDPGARICTVNGFKKRRKLALTD